MAPTRARIPAQVVTLEFQYRGFLICVAAAAEHEAVIVRARLVGGPAHISRRFIVPSDRPDTAQAYNDALTDLCTTVDDLLLPAFPKASPTARAPA